MALCSIWKGEGRRRKRAAFAVKAFVFQVPGTCDGALLSWKWLYTCLPMGRGELIPCFALPVYVASAFPIKLSIAQPTNSPTFTLLILSLIPLVGM